jgi:pimeloyl-ACP methyl ester carboxylesterase
MELVNGFGTGTIFTEILEHPEFEYNLFRQLGLAVYGAATLGECIATARGLPMWDIDGWMRSWAQIGEEVRQLAERSLEAGHTESASEHLLRAANYFQMAEYYAIICNGDHVALGQQAEECFLRAQPFLPWTSELVELAAGDKVFPAYFLRPDDSGAARSSVIVVTGAESSAEEQYFYHGVSALRRGYNVLLFQGPGQAGLLRRFPDSKMRHDYEIPLQVALDLLHDRREVDRERIAMIGNGLGSYFTTRVAALDPRVKAIVVNPPYVNFNRLVTDMIGPRALRIDVAYDELNEIPPSLMLGYVKLAVINLCRRFGVNRMQALIHATESYTVEDMLYRIHCPTLCICGRTVNEEMVAQSELFRAGERSGDFTKITIPNLHEADHYNFFSNLPRLNQEIFDWLDERFQRPPQ